MSKHRGILVVIFTAALAIVQSACQPAPIQPTQAITKPLVYADAQWVGDAGAYIAQEKGFFGSTKVNIVPKNSIADTFSALASRDADVAHIVLSDALAQASTGVPLQVVWVQDSSLGADVFVANKDITNVGDLKGKQIGLVSGSFGHLFVMSVLESKGFKPSDIQIVNTEPTDATRAILDGKIVGAHMYYPPTQKVMSNGGHILFTSADAPDVITDVMAVRLDVIKDRPQDVQAFVQGLADGMKWWASNDKEGNEIVAKHTGQKPEDIPDSMKTLVINRLADNLKLFDPNSDRSLYKISAKLVPLMKDLEIIKTDPDVQSILNSTFAQAAAQ